MKASEIFSIVPDDVAGDGTLLSSILALNNAHAKELSWLTPERLAHLVVQAFAARRIGALDAFLLAFDQDADYDSVNFHWFRQRLARFIYVDRIVASPASRGRGHARRLYGDLFADAVRHGHDRVVCEINSDPPNPRSDAFHAAWGFVEIGTGRIPGDKTVRYVERLL